jgi:hypothetical protein
MFEADNSRDWRDHDVVDPDGNKIGQLEAVYPDTANDVPAFAWVKTGMIGWHRLTFAPLDRATVAPWHVRVACSKRQVKAAFEIDTDGELAAEQEPGLFERYGLAYQPGASGEPACPPALNRKGSPDGLSVGHHRGHSPGPHRRRREGTAVPADHRRGGALGRPHLSRRPPARTPPGQVRQ